VDTISYQLYVIYYHATGVVIRQDHVIISYEAYHSIDFNYSQTRGII